MPSKTPKRTIRTAAIITAISALVAVFSTTFSTPANASAAITCVNTTPPGVSHGSAATEPSTHMGVFGEEAPASGDPSDRVNALAFDPASNVIVAGGVFSSYIWNGTSYQVHNVVAFDATTGEPYTAFQPDVDGEVLTVAISCTGTAVFIGGTFHHVGSSTRNYAAKLSLATGSLSNWDPNPNGIVQSIALIHDHLIVAGNFTKICGVARSNIASLNSTTAVVDNWLKLSITGHDLDGPKKVIKVIGNHAGTAATILGNFNEVNGHPHRAIAMLHITGSAATLYPWNTPLTEHACSDGFAAPILDAAYTPGDTRLITVSTGGAHANSLCDVATKWNATDTSNTTAKPMAQQWTGGDSMSGIACTSDTCFVGGHFRWGNNPPIQPQVPGTDCSDNASHAGYNCAGPTAVDRKGVEEIDIASMKVTQWNPGHARQEGMHDAFLITTQGVFDASDGDTAGGIPRNDLAFWPFS